VNTCQAEAPYRAGISTDDAVELRWIRLVRRRVRAAQRSPAPADAEHVVDSRFLGERSAESASFAAPAASNFLNHPIV